jgi:PAS domain S-box-containing protein
MDIAEFQLQAIVDPRLAVHAASAHPAWLWSSDGSRILWANPVGAKAFGAANAAALTEKVFGPADSHRRQVIQLARNLPASGAIRLQRLRGFGARLGALVTCACARLDFADTSHGILLAATDKGDGAMPLAERLQRLVEGLDCPIVAFTREGILVGASAAARPLLGLHNLAEADLGEACREALRQGRIETTVGGARMVLQRVGTGADIGLIAMMTPEAMEPPRAIVTADPVKNSPAADSAATIAFEISPQTDLEAPVDTPKDPTEEPIVEPSQETLDEASSLEEAPGNVLPFRPIGETKSPALTAVENNAFDELARQLSARLEHNNNGTTLPTPEASQANIEQVAAFDAPAQPSPSEPPGWLSHPEPPARGEARRDKMLLDLLPVGILIYRLDRLLYANPSFLERMGYQNLHALEQAGGLDALYVEPGVSTASSTSDTGTPVKIYAAQASSEQAPPSATEARLFTISWDDDSALALIFSNSRTESADIAAAIRQAPPAPAPSAVGHANAEELGAILDIATEGVVMFDAEGNIHSCNRSAETLFGFDGAELVRRNLNELFAPESQRVAQDYLESIKAAGVAGLLDQGREALGRVRGGGLIPLSLTMGRTRPGRPNFFAVFRDLSQAKKSESELREARRTADRAANAKADILARISHEVRTPLNAIIGFAEVMIGERFGALGNERYVEYMKDIRASGERVIAMIDELLDLSRIETGKLNLAFANQNLNELVEGCVAAMQPQANRERIIIRTSLAHMLPQVFADARALRQITLNLIGNSIHLANTGGQVIVSTALSDFGEVVLRVRDTGHGLNDNEVAAAMEPFRAPAPSDQASDSPGVSLSLTKALVEANRAQFHIKTGPRSGTLVEVVFPHLTAKV